MTSEPQTYSAAETLVYHQFLAQSRRWRDLADFVDSLAPTADVQLIRHAIKDLEQRHSLG